MANIKYALMPSVKMKPILWTGGWNPFLKQTVL